MKSVNPIIFSLIICIIFSSASIYIVYKVKDKTGYVNLAELHNNFDLKKSLELKLENNKKAKVNYLDSLKRDLNYHQQLFSSLPNNKQLGQLLEYKIEVLNATIKGFEEQTIKLTEEYDQQIWLQLNSYVKEYGTKNQYDYIYGINGEGSVMYASESNNITNELIVHINRVC